MSERVRALIPTLANWSAAEKAELIELLKGNDNRDEKISREEWEEAWVEECNRRMADLEAGKTKLIPGDVFMKELKEKYG